jgi:uncharacterized membrane protein YccC
MQERRHGLMYIYSAVFLLMKVAGFLGYESDPSAFEKQLIAAIIGNAAF